MDDDPTPPEVKLQQAEAYAALLSVACDSAVDPAVRVTAARSVLQFSTPGYFNPAEMVEDE